VVDELHTYRGTPGTEVGYLLRALLHRLGLSPDSPQLRIIATSASIEDTDESRDYLEQFFGKDRGSFQIVPGHPAPFVNRGVNPSTFKPAFEAFDRGMDDADPRPAACSLAQALGVSPTSRDAGQILADVLDSIGALDLVG